MANACQRPTGPESSLYSVYLHPAGILGLEITQSKILGSKKRCGIAIISMDKRLDAGVNIVKMLWRRAARAASIEPLHENENTRLGLL